MISRHFIPVISALFFFGQACAEPLPVAQSLAELKAQGYVVMNKINTPLLFPAITAGDFDARFLLSFGQADLSTSAAASLADKLSSSNEFEAHEALLQLLPDVQNRINALKSARGYIIQAVAKLGKYDFSNQRFPLSIDFSSPQSRNTVNAHCAGGYKKQNNKRYIACIVPTNWKKNNAFNFLSIDDEKNAETIKNGIKNQTMHFYFVMEPSNEWKTVNKPSAVIDYFGFPEPVVIGGYTPAAIRGLILLDHKDNNNIVISGGY